MPYTYPYGRLALPHPRWKILSELSEFQKWPLAFRGEQLVNTKPSGKPNGILTVLHLIGFTGAFADFTGDLYVGLQWRSYVWWPRMIAKFCSKHAIGHHTSKFRSREADRQCNREEGQQYLIDLSILRAFVSSALSWIRPHTFRAPVELIIPLPHCTACCTTSPTEQ